MPGIIGSLIESKICINCEVTKDKVLPFLAVNIINLDLKNIQKSYELNILKERSCINCKGKCTFNQIFNNILALEVEPKNDIAIQKKISIENLAPTINVGKLYKLYAVVEFDPTLKHFTSHVKRINGKWKTYDDLKFFEMTTDESNEILPYMLFYITDNYDNCFKYALQEKALIRKVNFSIIN